LSHVEQPLLLVYFEDVGQATCTRNKHKDVLSKTWSGEQLSPL